MTAKLHTFNGEQLTVQQIKQRVPNLSVRTLYRHIASGRNTTAAIMQYDSHALQIAGARRGGLHRNSQEWKGGGFR